MTPRQIQLFLKEQRKLAVLDEVVKAADEALDVLRSSLRNEREEKQEQKKRERLLANIEEVLMREDAHEIRELAEHATDEEVLFRIALWESHRAHSKCVCAVMPKRHRPCEWCETSLDARAWAISRIKDEVKLKYIANTVFPSYLRGNAVMSIHDEDFLISFIDDKWQYRRACEMAIRSITSHDLLVKVIETTSVPFVRAEAMRRLAYCALPE